MFATLTFGTIVSAEGALMMKGIHHDIPFEAACKIMSTFKTNRGEFILNKKRKKCGFGRNGLISYPHITGRRKSDHVEKIVLSPEVVDDLFNTETLNITAFSQVFLNRYNWIDAFRTTRIYRQESKKYGWKLSINRKKWIRITFL